MIHRSIDPWVHTFMDECQNRRWLNLIAPISPVVMSLYHMGEVFNMFKAVDQNIQEHFFYSAFHWSNVVLFLDDERKALGLGRYTEDKQPCQSPSRTKQKEWVKL